MKNVSAAFPVVRGLNATNQALAQPKGIVARISNMLFTKRGALATCDGSAIVAWAGGAVQAGRGQVLCVAQFAPTGVAPYLLALILDKTQTLGPPNSLVATQGSAGGVLTVSTTFFYKVTAVDGQGNETTASGESSASTGNPTHKINLVWNVVPNAAKYNVYRGTVTNQEVILTIPVVQPSPIAATVSYTDDGLNPVGIPTPPVSDTTQQIVLMKFTGTSIPLSYTIAFNTLLARFPPVPTALGQAPLGVPVTVRNAVAGSTASGGIANACSLIPQMAQFQNQMILALGNGFPAQIYNDATTAVNPALGGQVTQGSENVAGTIATYTTALAHGLTAGTQVVITGFVVTTGFNGTFVVITTPSTTTFTVSNTNATANVTEAPPATAAWLATTTAIVAGLPGSFVPQFPVWVTASLYAIGSVVVPTAGNLHYYKAIQGGTSGGSQPTWPLGTGSRVTDNNIIWQEAGLVNAAAPPPPGIAHVAVYSGSIWAWDTNPTDAATGISGPCALQMCDLNNVNSWNPVNVAFLDKDDGFEGMGLAAFTISAQGIPPQGSLVAFKQRATYQILGVFGSSNFAIQRVKTDMGCLAPRTAQFVPGFGLVRLTHLGFAAFDGVDDRIISEELHPYLFSTVDTDSSDITAMDPTWAPVAWATQTANPPMYICAVPVGVSLAQGQLTRLFCYDLVLKAWSVIDLPFAFACLAQVQVASSAPLTLAGGYLDGTIQRLQSGDPRWYDNGGGGNPVAVTWSFRTATMASKEANQRLYCRRIVIRGISTTASAPTVTIRLNGVAQTARTTAKPATGDFDLFVDVDKTALRFDAKVLGTGIVEIDDVSFQIDPRPVGVPLVVA